jgi:hypothetical protein
MTIIMLDGVVDERRPMVPDPVPPAVDGMADWPPTGGETT